MIGCAPRWNAKGGSLTRLWTGMLAGLAMLLISSTLLAEQRFPPPEFETEYRMPSTTQPPPDALGYQVADIAVLAITLLLGVWLVIHKRSRKGIVALGIFSIAYFGFWRQGCVCSIGSVQNVALAIVDSRYALPIGAAVFFTLPLLVAIFFGRVFCAAVCPFGALQDLVLLKPLRLPRWLDQSLGLLPHIYLGVGVLLAALGTRFLICQYDPMVPFFRLDGPSTMFFLGVGLMLLATVIARPYCRFLCPYSVLLSWASRFSQRQVTVYPDNCIRCRLCEKSCPINVIDAPMAPPSPTQLSRARVWLLATLLLLPVLTALGLGLGLWLGPKLAHAHPAVILAEDLKQQELALAQGKRPPVTDQLTAFQRRGATHESALREARQVRWAYQWGTALAGAWIGLVIGFKFIQLVRLPVREEYQAHPGDCVACGRCYEYCPKGRELPAATANPVPLTIMAGNLNSPTFIPAPRRPAAWLTASVAAVFLVVVGTWMFLHTRGPSPLLEDHALRSLTQELRSQPGSVVLQTKIRELDAQLRQDERRRRAFAQTGAWMLLGGAMVLLMSLKSALAPGALVLPPAILQPVASRDDRFNHSSLLATGVLAILVVSVTVAYAWRTDPHAWIDRPALAAASSQPSQDWDSPEEVARQWPRFHGPDGNGVAALGNRLPETWDGPSGKNILWKAPVPLAGHNSPVIWGDRLFLSGGSTSQRAVFCFDARTGSLLWTRPVEPARDRSGNLPTPYEDTGYAAPTMAVDSRFACALFSTGELAGLDHQGQLLWSKNLDLEGNPYGQASSLLLDRRRLIVQVDRGQLDEKLSTLWSLDPRTGRPIWQIRRSVAGSWASPILFQQDGRRQLLTIANPQAISYDPEDGRELWRAKLMHGEVAPSPVLASGLAIVIDPGSKTMAVRTDGRDDVTASHVVWTSDRFTSDIPTPVSSQGLLFIADSTGMLWAINVSDGAKLWEMDLETTVRASPIVVGQRLYVLSEEGVMFVLAVDKTKKLLGRMNLGQKCYASPAVVGNRMYIRGIQDLFCIGESAVQDEGKGAGR